MQQAIWHAKHARTRWLRVRYDRQLMCQLICQPRAAPALAKRSARVDVGLLERCRVLGGLNESSQSSSEACAGATWPVVSTSSICQGRPVLPAGCAVSNSVSPEGVRVRTASVFSYLSGCSILSCASSTVAALQQQSHALRYMHI